MDLLLKTYAGLPGWNWGLQLLGLVTSYVGAELNARLRISGFYVWLGSNVLLGVLHAVSGLWLLLVLDLLYSRVNTLGIVRWSRERPERTPTWLRKLLRRRADSQGTPPVQP